MLCKHHEALPHGISAKPIAAFTIPLTAARISLIAAWTASRVRVVIPTMIPMVARICMSSKACAPSGVKSALCSSIARIWVVIFFNSGIAKSCISFQIVPPSFSPAPTIALSNAVKSRAIVASDGTAGFLGDLDRDRGTKERADAADQNYVPCRRRDAPRPLRLVEVLEVDIAALHLLHQNHRAIILRHLVQVPGYLRRWIGSGDGFRGELRGRTRIERLVGLRADDQGIDPGFLGEVPVLVRVPASLRGSALTDHFVDERD